MHPPVWNHTLPHARAWRRIATGPDSILVGRPQLLKLILAGLAVVVLLGASACGGGYRRRCLRGRRAERQATRRAGEPTGHPR